MFMAGSVHCPAVDPASSLCSDGACGSVCARVCACSVCSAVLRVRFVSASIHVNGSARDFAVR